MCNCNGCTILCQLFKTLLDPTFTFIVQCTGRLIQNQDWRILKENSGNRNSLLLSTGKPGSSFSDKCFISIRKFHNKVMDIGFLCRIFNLFHRSVRLTICNIFTDTSTEKINILLHKTNLITQTLKGQLSHIFSVNRNLSTCYIVKSWKQGTNCCLATSRRTNQRN